MRDMKRLLIVVDLQNDFVDGALGAEGGTAALENARALISKERARGTEVVFTKDLHGGNYLETQEGKRLPVPHCIAGTAGAEFSAGVFAEGARVFEKETFASVALGEYARSGAFDEILFAGICTDICVVSNALLVKAFCPNARIAVISAACAGTTRENHLCALNVMKSCQIDIE